MKKHFFALLLISSVAAKAQNKSEAAVRNISIDPISRTIQNTKKNVIFNETTLIPVSKGDKFTLQPNLILLPRQHKLIKGVLKSAAVFAVTYKASNNINKDKSNNISKKNTNLTPALGVGLAIGLPNIIQGLKNKKSYLLYTLYDANKIPVFTQKILLTKQANSYTFKNTTGDGFLHAIVVGNTNKMRAGNFDIVISDETEIAFKGAIGGNFDLNSYGDCQQGGGDGDVDYSNPCRAACTVAYLAIQGVLLASYIAEMAGCSGLIFPPLITACCIGVTAEFAIQSGIAAYALTQCLSACPSVN